MAEPDAGFRQAGTYQYVMARRGGLMLAFILFLIILWIVLGIIGAVVHGLIWLLIIAAILFLATLLFGGARLGRGRRRVR
jgi:uncharacterized RDD family membrane protein YckC